jgi:hypothetical protein
MQTVEDKRLRFYKPSRRRRRARDQRAKDARFTLKSASPSRLKSIDRQVNAASDESYF